MSLLCDRVNADSRLDDVDVRADDAQALITFEVVPVLATPLAAVALFTAGLAVEEAADR